ncbi:MAG: hypothetical protein WHS63_13165 [Tenuifilum sp.]|uniref:hypothetical protein n=1 Tax=Tenuifilum sp. TaxID=2760880 RepID=UPI003098D40E
MSSINSQAAYLFLVPKADGGLQGYMPFNRQFGFVVAPTGSDGNVDAAALARTVAHELGHGIFSLRHTFSEKNFVTLPQGKTDNLMDYPSTGSGLATATDATKLDKYQWGLIHNPEKIWFAWLQEEEEAELSLPCLGWFDDCDDVLKILEKLREARINNKNPPPPARADLQSVRLYCPCASNSCNFFLKFGETASACRTGTKLRTTRPPTL